MKKLFTLILIGGMFACGHSKIEEEALEEAESEAAEEQGCPENCIEEHSIKCLDRKKK